MESLEDANAACTPGEGSPARSPRRWQFTLAGMFLLTTLAAVALSIGSTVGWDRVGDLVLIPLFLAAVFLYFFGPIVGMMVWMRLRKRPPGLRIGVPAALVALIGVSPMVLGTLETLATQNDRLLEFACALCTVVLYLWVPQLFIWWIAAFPQKAADRDKDGGP